MPSTSLKQHNLMAMVATNPDKAKSLGIKQSVGKDFLQADKGKKFVKGGMAKGDVNNPKTNHGTMDLPNFKLGKFKGMKTGGAVKKRKFDEGGEVEDDGNDFSAEPERRSFAGGVKMSSDYLSESKPKKAAPKKAPRVTETAKAETKPAKSRYSFSSDDAPAAPKAKSRYSFSSDDSPAPKTAKSKYSFSRGGGIESRGKTKGRFV